MTDDPLEPVQLTSVPHELGAGVIVAALAEAGIRATMQGVNTAEFRTAVPGWVQIYVAEQDLSRAQEILQQVQEDHDHIDWSQVDVGEPEEE